MTENATPTTATNRTMNDVSHTNPKTGRPFGERVVFARGPTVAADGGERTDGSRSSSDSLRSTDDGKRDPETVDDEETEDAETDDRMEDVDHEPPSETEANPVFERGREGRDDAR